MINKYHVVLFATIYGVIFTALTYLIPDFGNLWLALGIFLQPLFYSEGYGFLIEHQKEEMDAITSQQQIRFQKIVEENKYLKRLIKQQDRQK